jgi:hypothetical protein
MTPVTTRQFRIALNHCLFSDKAPDHRPKASGCAGIDVCSALRTETYVSSLASCGAWREECSARVGPNVWLVHAFSENLVAREDARLRDAC